MKIVYTDKEDCILEIINNLPGKNKIIRKYENSIIIPTSKGATQVYIGDTIYINDDEVVVIKY